MQFISVIANMFRFIFTCIYLLFIASCSYTTKFNHNSTKKLYNNNPSKKEISLEQNLINKINYDNSYIKLLTPDEVLVLVGTPTLINKINNIEVWQYRRNFILNIVWNKQSSIKNNITNKTLNIASTASPELNSSIIWLECIGLDKHKLEANSCFLQLINF